MVKIRLSTKYIKNSNKVAREKGPKSYFQYLKKNVLTRKSTDMEGNVKNSLHTCIFINEI